MTKRSKLAMQYLLLAAGFSSCGSKNNSINNSSNPDKSFYLTYAHAGLGSNMLSKQPVFSVTGTKFIYALEQNGFDGQQTKNADTILIGTMRRASIDSITNLVKGLGDTTIFKSNPNIMSGGIYYLTIALGQDTVRYELMNTYDRTAMKIIDIINPYLPADEINGQTNRITKQD